MSSHDEDLLRRALHAQASRAGTGQVDLESVTSRARGIRRRRTAAAALSTAAVLALAVPFGLAITGTAGDDGAPPVAGPSVDASGDPTSTGQGARLVEVDLLEGAQAGGEPAGLPYLLDGEIVSPDGTRVDVPGDGSPVSLAVLGDRWLVIKDLGEGRHTLDTVDASGELTGSVPAQPDLVMSDDGTVAAYVSGDGDVHTVTAQDGDTVLAGAGEAASPAAVVGSRTCSEGSGCTVVLNQGMGGVRQVGSDELTEELQGFEAVADATPTQALGMVSVREDGSTCSALRDDSGTVWETCDNSFGELSQDGRHAVGYPSYTDGLGPKSVSIVDAADGRELVRFADDGRTDTHVRDVVWESDTSLLVTVWDGEDRSWSLLRAGVDGSLAEVATGLPGDDMDPALHLPER